MKSNFRRALREIGGPDFGKPKNYASILPVSLMGGVVISDETPDPISIAGYFLANAFGLFVCVLVGFVIWILRRQTKEFLHPLAVFLVAVFIGLVKASSTALLLAILGFEDFFTGLQDRLVGATTAAVLTVYMISLFFSLKKTFEEDRKHLIATRVSRDQARFASNKLEELENFVLQIEKKIRSGNAPKHPAQLLRELLEIKVRPLSRELWEREEKRLRSFDLRELITRAILIEPYPSLLLGLVFLILTPSFLVIFLEGGAQSLLLVVQTLALVLTFFIVNLVKRIRSELLTILVSIAALVQIAALISFVFPGLILGFIPENSLVIFFFLLIFIPNVGIAVAVIVYFLRSGSAQTQSLKAEQAEALPSSEDELESFILGRELAGALHGKVQNQILISLANIESGAALMAELDSVKAAIRQLNQLNQGNKSMTASEIVDSWRGLVNVEIDDSKVLSRMQAWVIEEAISNSFRHGKATSVKVAFSQDGKKIMVADDGFGPLVGKDGLGKKIYSAAGDWTLLPGATGGSVLEITLRP